MRAILLASGLVFAATSVHATSTIEGTVVSAANAQPLANVTVSAGITPLGFSALASATTDANGHYSITINAGNYAVQANGGDFWVLRDYSAGDCPSNACSVIHAGVNIADGQTISGINFALNPAGTISGVVRDAISGIPVRGASITVPAAGNGSYYALSVVDGTFHIGSVAPGDYRALANASNYLREYVHGEQCDPFVNCDTLTVVTDHVAANAQTNLQFELDHGAAISGSADSEDHLETLASVAVYLYNEDDIARPSIVANTDADHHYRFDKLAARHYRVRFGSPQNSRFVSEYYNDVPCAQDPCNFAAATVLFPAAGQSISGIDALLHPRQSVSGTVLDENSQPIAGATVHALRYQSGVLSFWSELVRARTDALGHYVLSGLPTGDFTVRADASGFLGMQRPGHDCHQFNHFCDDFTSDATNLNVATDQALSGIDLTLTRAAVVRGRITEKTNGIGLSLAWVHLLDANGFQIAQANTDRDGWYELPGLATGTLTLRAGDVGHAQLWDHIDCPGQTNTCPLPSATALAVTAPQQRSDIHFTLPDADAVFSCAFDH